MKLNKIDEVWNSANPLFKWRFGFDVVQKFCYHRNVTERLLLFIDGVLLAPSKYGERYEELAGGLEPIFWINNK